MNIKDAKVSGMIKTILNASMASENVKICLLDIMKMTDDEIKSEVRRCIAAEESFFEDYRKFAMDGLLTGPVNFDAEEKLLDATKFKTDFFSYEEVLNVLEAYFGDRDIPGEMTGDIGEAFMIPFSRKTYDARNEAINRLLTKFQ